MIKASSCVSKTSLLYYECAIDENKASWWNIVCPQAMYNNTTRLSLLQQIFSAAHHTKYIHLWKAAESGYIFKIEHARKLCNQWNVRHTNKHDLNPSRPRSFHLQDIQNVFDVRDHRYPTRDASASVCSMLYQAAPFGSNRDWILLFGIQPSELAWMLDP